MHCNSVIKNYLNNTGKGWILRTKPLQYKIKSNKLGVIFADRKINFQNEEAILKYITTRLVDSLNRPQPKQFERVIVKKGLTIMGEADGEAGDCAEALKSIIGPFEKRKYQNVSRDLEVFHSHPDSSFNIGTSPLSEWDIFSAICLKLKKIVAINSKGEFNSMEISNKFSKKNYKKFREDYEKNIDQELYGGLMAKVKRLAKVMNLFYKVRGNSKLVLYLSQKCDKFLEEIENIYQKKYKNADVFKVLHEFYQKADKYEMKYSTNFSSLIDRSGS